MENWQTFVLEMILKGMAVWGVIDAGTRVLKTVFRIKGTAVRVLAFFIGVGFAFLLYLPKGVLTWRDYVSIGLYAFFCTILAHASSQIRELLMQRLGGGMIAPAPDPAPTDDTQRDMPARAGTGEAVSPEEV